MKIIFKSMVSLLVLANLAGAASKDDAALDLTPAFGALTVRSQDGMAGERVEEIRQNIQSIIMNSGAAKRKAEAIEKALQGLPAGMTHVSVDQVTLKTFAAQQDVDGLWRALGIAPIAPSQVALLDEEVDQLPQPLEVTTVNALPLPGDKEEEVAATPQAPVLALVWFDPAFPNAGLEEQRLALVSAEQTMLANADLLGKRAEAEAAMATANTQLKAADDYYQDLIAAVLGMKQDLSEIQIPRLKQFSASQEEAAPETYIDLLVNYLTTEGRQIEFIPVQGQQVTPREQIHALQNLLAQARESLAVARGELERINQGMLQLQ